MKYKQKTGFILLLLTGLVFNQPFAQYEIKKYTINSGGAVMTGGIYSMQSSIGQVDASPQLSNGVFALKPGFWQESTNVTDLIFKNDFE